MISLSVLTDRVTYRPGDDVQIECTVTSLGEAALDVTLNLEITDPFGTVVNSQQKSTLLERGGTARIAFRWRALPNALAAYVARARATEGGSPVVVSACVFDVAREWTAVPRYGFFAIYPGGPEDVEGKLDRLAGFHINAIQFYDWFENHGDYLPRDGSYSLLGKQMSRARVVQKIAAAKRRGMKALAYAVIYAASDPVYEGHKESVLTDSSGRPLRFEDWLYFMNPERRSEWQTFLTSELLKSVREFGWDGVHLDQYGRKWTRSAYWRGHRVSMGKAFTSFINALAAGLEKTSPGSAVVFNCVDAWPLESVARRSASRFTYIEVWPPHDTYRQVQNLIGEARRYNRRKAVVLAAYCPVHLPTILLLDALIFSNRAFHIEVGEGLGYLVDPYFPKYSTLSNEAARRLRQYYEAITRYEEYIYDDDLSNLRAGTVRLLTHPFSETPEAGKVLVRAYRKGTQDRLDALTINLVNFGGVKSMLWNSVQNEPRTARGIIAAVRLPKRAMERLDDVLCVTPDGRVTNPRLLRHGFDRHQSAIRFEIPDLAYWQLVIVRFA
jgi:dextranase